jgi:hypothetical protein
MPSGGFAHLLGVTDHHVVEGENVAATEANLPKVLDHQAPAFR